MKPLRILVGADVPPDPNSGAAGTVVQTNQALRDLGHHVDEFWSRDLTRRIQHGNLHYLLELPRGYRSAVDSRCEDNQYDVIQLSQPYAWLAARRHQDLRRHGVFVNRSHGLELMADASVSHWRKRLGLPENRFPRSLLTTVLRRLLHRQTYRGIRHFDGLIVPATDIESFLISHVRAEKSRVRVIQHGVNPLFATTAAEPMTEDRLKRMLYVGQYAFIKGPDILCTSLNSILRAFPESSVTWVTSAAHHEEIAAGLDAGIRPRVTFQDWVKQEDLLSVYDTHGVFLWPSLYEGYGKACFEAMSRGLCVIASDVGGAPDIVEHGVNGFLTPAGDVQAIVDAASQLLPNVERAREISARAATTAGKLTWAKCATEATDFYRELLDLKKV